MSAASKLIEHHFQEYYVDTPSVRLCVREYGDPNGVPVLMIMGLGCQITHWPEHLINALLQQPIRLICFDNRDTGLSENIRSQFKVDTRLAYLSHKVGLQPQANYSLHDMAADTASLIRTLDAGPVHIVGVSMGGMIAQLMGAHYADLVSSLTIMMSSTNSPKMPLPEFSLMLKFGLAGRAPKDKEDQIKRWMGFWKLVQSPAYKSAKGEIEAMVRAGFDRNYSPSGTLRQLQAILATGSLSASTRQIQTPTQIIHGESDPLLKPVCGKAIAKRIEGSELHIIPGMGHDLPRQLSPKLSQMIHRHVQDTELHR